MWQSESDCSKFTFADNATTDNSICLHQQSPLSRRRARHFAAFTLRYCILFLFLPCLQKDFASNLLCHQAVRTACFISVACVAGVLPKIYINLASRSAPSEAAWQHVVLVRQLWQRGNGGNGGNALRLPGLSSACF